MTRSRSLVFLYFNITARIPLQSPVGSEEPTGDSFPPGEAMCAAAQVEPSFIYHSDFRRGQCRPLYGIGKAHPERGALVLILSIYALCAFDIFASANSIYRPAIRYDINPPRPAGHIARLRISKAEPISKIRLGIYIDPYSRGSRPRTGWLRSVSQFSSSSGSAVTVSSAIMSVKFSMP